MCLLITTIYLYNPHDYVIIFANLAISQKVYDTNFWINFFCTIKNIFGICTYKVLKITTKYIKFKKEEGHSKYTEHLQKVL
jgi:hypothetical protein